MGKKIPQDEKDAIIEIQKQEIQYLTNMLTSTLDFVDATENSFSNLRDTAKKTWANSPMNRQKIPKKKG